MISRHRAPQVVRPGWIFWFTSLLGRKSGFSQITIKNARRDFISDDGLDGGPTYVDFAARVVCCPVDRSRTNLRLKDWRHRLRFVLQAALHPSELRSIERRHLDHGDANVTLVVNQF